MSIKVMQLHKRSSYVFANIQDKYAISHNAQIIAVSDGATQGYQSEVWAEILTQAFIKNPSFDKKAFYNFLLQQVTTFAHHESRTEENVALKALQQKKREQGAFATFIACKINPQGNTLNYIACGDSCLFVWEKGKVQSYPFHSDKELNEEYISIGTKHLEQNTFLQEQIYTGSVTLSSSARVYVMTDAIARYTFQHQSIIQEIDRIENFAQWKTLIEDKWKTHSLEEDDITVIAWQNEGNHIPHIIAPPSEFSYPKEKPFEYITKPSSTPSAYAYQHSSMQGDIASLRQHQQVLQQENEKLLHKLQRYKQLSIGLGCIWLFTLILGITLPKIKDTQKNKDVTIFKQIIQIIPWRNSSDTTQVKSNEKDSLKRNDNTLKSPIEPIQKLKLKQEQRSNIQDSTK